MKKSVSILDAQSGAVIIPNACIAETAWERTVGLLGKSVLSDGEGMLLPKTSSIHTFFMRFPIDAVFLSAEGVILKISPAPPWRMRLCLGAAMTLEIPFENARKHSLREGQQLLFKR